MTGIWRPLAVAAALIVTLAATATAQTVIVAKTPPGTSVTVGLNTTTLQTATSGEDGGATIPLNLLAARPDKAGTDKTELDVRVFVDVCEKSRNVWLLETGWQPPAAGAGCARHELFGTFAVRSITSLVVDAAEETQAVWIRQGTPPARWLDPNAQPEREGGPEWPLPTGIVLFGGLGLGSFHELGLIACGVGTDYCTPSNKPLTFQVGADYWLNRYLAVTGSYMKPYRLEVLGYGSGYRFSTYFSPNVATMGGKFGLSVSRVRFYGEGGAVYQRGNYKTTQMVDPITVTVNGEPTTFPGGVQVFNFQTSGWSWMAGGGAEVWVKRNWAIYGEAGWLGLKGTPIAGGEGSLNDRLLYFVAGVRLRLSR